MVTKRYAKHIDDPKVVEEILSLSRERCCEKSLIMDLFADFGKGPRFNPYDTIDIPAGVYGNTKKNKNKFRTTIGLYIFNKGSIEEFSDILGYINKTVDKKVYGSINEKLSYALLENKISLDRFKRFLLQGQIYMSCCSAIAPSHTEAIFDLHKAVTVKKKELNKKYAKAIEEKDVAKMTEYEKELIDFAKDYLKDDPSADMYNSGARSSWENNFKNMYLTRNPLQKTDGTYAISTDSYMDGMDPKDFADINDAAVAGPYSRSNKTADGGYKEKLFTAATQHIKVLGEGSDCGTKMTIPVYIDKSNMNQYLYSFVLDGSKFVEITSDNINKYMNKEVKIRYSGFCKAKNGYICEKCMGTLYRRIGIKNVGLSTMAMMSAIKLGATKLFHDSSTNIYNVDPKSVF